MLQFWRVHFEEWSVLLLLSISILWKGGKSLDSTWMLAGLMVVLTLSYWMKRGIGRSSGGRASTDMHLPVRHEVSLTLWAVSLSFIIWTILSYIQSSTLNYGLDTVLRTIAYILLFLWMIRLNTLGLLESFKKNFPPLLTAVTAVAGVIGIVVYVFQPVNRFVGTFFDYRFHTDYWPNAWAEYVLLAWPIVFFVALEQTKKLKHWLTLVLLSFVLATLLLSYSRGALIAFMGQLFFMTVLFSSVALRDIRYRRTLLRLSRTIAVRLASVAAMAIVFFFLVNAARASFHNVQSVSEKITFNAAEGRSSINERAQFWDNAFQMIAERPLFGWGPYSFRFVQPRMMTDVLATSDHPHNVLLKIAAEEGIPAMVLFSIIVLIAIKSSVLSFLFCRKSYQPRQDAFIILFIASASGLMLHSMIDYNIQFISIGMLWMIILGLLMSPVRSLAQSPVASSFLRWKWSMFLSRTEVLITIIMAFILLWEGAHLVTSSAGRHAHAAGNTDAAMRWYERSENELFSRDLFLSMTQIALSKHLYGRADKAIATYMALNQQDPRAWKLRGEIALKRGRFDEAKTAFETAYELGRYTDMGIVRLYVDVLRRLDDREKLLSMKHEFDSLFIRYAHSIRSNAHFIALSHNPEELLAISRSLSETFPLDERRYKTIARDAFSAAQKERAVYASRPKGMLW